jgi:hypothetical protein
VLCFSLHSGDEIRMRMMFSRLSNISTAFAFFVDYSYFFMAKGSFEAPSSSSLSQWSEKFSSDMLFIRIIQ